jgi:hypothetical protein
MEFSPLWRSMINSTMGGNSWFPMCKCYEFYLLEFLWVALGKGRTRNTIWILDGHKSSVHYNTSSGSYWHSNELNLTYSSHWWVGCQFNITSCGNLPTLVVVCIHRHNFHCHKFLMPWPRYRMESPKFLIEPSARNK